MKKLIGRILIVSLCTLLLFSGVCRNVDEHIPLGEGIQQEVDTAAYEHKIAYFDPLAVFADVFDSVLSAVAIPVRAEEGVECEHCGAYRYGDWLCENGDHCGEGSGTSCYEEHHCGYCGACDDDHEMCDDCGNCLEDCCECDEKCRGCYETSGDVCDVCGEKCTECVDFICDDCGICAECAGNELYCSQCMLCIGCADWICYCGEGCSECTTGCEECNEKCLNCAEDELCTDCGTCFDCLGGDGNYCSECLLCKFCTEYICECGRGCAECVLICEQCQEKCEECADGGICEDCGVCYDCVGGDGNFCQNCNLCKFCVDQICVECSEGCSECAIICPECNAVCENCGDNQLCGDCEVCFECRGGEGNYCEECGLCKMCVEYVCACGNGCSECSYVCTDCGEKCTACAEEELCIECGTCFECVGGEGNFCSACGYCKNCVEQVCYCGNGCSECSVICVTCGEKCENCAPDELCADCGICRDCVGGDGNFCDTCSLCKSCVDYVCVSCSEGCSNCADICPECGEKCSNCAEDELCTDCGICRDCIGGDGNFCDTCALCKNCVDYICYNCGQGCSNCAQICEDCGEKCSECAADELCMECGKCVDCAGADNFCVTCGLCSDCAKVCPCGEGCENCADLCPDCEEKCSNCMDEFCASCDICRECADDIFCENCYQCGDCVQVCEDCGVVCVDCAENVCKDCGKCSGCIDEFCPDCGICIDCADIMCRDCYYCGDCEENICVDCGEYCSDCADICEECVKCENCVDICPDCDLCQECCAEVAADMGCEHKICPESAEWKYHYCSEGGHCAGESSEIGYDADEHWTLCGNECNVRLNSESHTFDAGVVTKEATKDAAGVMEFTCTFCDFTKEEAIPKLSDNHTHKYTDTVTKPTCLAGGYTTHTCECGHTYVDMQTPAVKHSYINKYADSEHWQECEYCHITTEKAAHKFRGWITVVKPGYTFKGEKQCACKICGYTIKEAIPSLTVPDGKVVVIIPDYDKYVTPDTNPDDPTSTPGGSEATPSIKELVTKGKESRIPALPILPPKAEGNFFAGWANKATGEMVKKGDLLTGNIEIVPVWMDCGEDNHTDADENNICDDCGYILKQPSNSDEKPTTDDEQNSNDMTQKNDGIPTWVIILISCLGVVLVAGGVVLVIVLKKKKQ